MAGLTLDQLKATRATLLTIQSQIGGAINDIDAALAAIPTTADLQDLLSQLMDAAPSVIKAVTPDSVTP
jgi:hypothetical protein